ncbi:MAG: SGNH/GDSL hydrolase family protein [Myxococcota bacterium]
MADLLMGAAIAAAPLLCALALRRFFRGRVRARRSGGLALVVGNALVLALLLSVALLGAEVYYRFVYDETDSWGVTRTDERWYDRHFRLNNIDVRDDVDYAMTLPDGRRRLSFLGDSFTMGAGVKRPADRFANRVRDVLAPGWETHVLAYGGLDTHDQIVLLTRAIDRGYRVDRVVLVYCLNDISPLIPEWQALHRRIYEAAGDLAFPFRHSFALNTLYFRSLTRREPELLRYFDFLGDAYAGEAWRGQRRRLELLEAVVEAGGGELLVVTFPFVHALEGPYPHAAAHQALGAFWESSGVAHLDLLDVFRAHAGEDLVVNRWDAHPNERAHAIAAGAIARFLAGRPAPARKARLHDTIADALLADGRAGAAEAIYELVQAAQPGDPVAKRALARAARGATRSAP